MGLAPIRRQKIKLPVRPRNESIDAGSDKNRYLHQVFLISIPEPV
jgi:hypothetical protein